MIASLSARLQRHITIPCGGEITIPLKQPVRLTLPKPYPAGSGYTWALLGPLPKPGLGEVLVLGEETTPADIPGAPVTTTWILEWLPPVDQRSSEGLRPSEELRFALIRPWEASEPADTCSCKVKFE